MPKYEIEITSITKTVHTVQVEASSMREANILSGNLCNFVKDSNTETFPFGKVYVSTPDNHFAKVVIAKVEGG